MKLTENEITDTLYALECSHVVKCHLSRKTKRMRFSIYLIMVILKLRLFQLHLWVKLRMQTETPVHI